METKIKTIIISTIVLLYACNSSISLVSKPIYYQWSDAVYYNKPSIIERRNEIWLRYILYGDSCYSIEWGNKKQHHKSDSIYMVLGSGVFRWLDNDSQYIILDQNTGLPRNYQYLLLPLKKEQGKRIFQDARAYDLKRKLIAYVMNTEDFVIRVENYETGTTNDIVIRNRCNATYPGDCIEDVYFKGKKLYIEWYNSENILTKQLFPIDLQFNGKQ